MVSHRFASYGTGILAALWWLAPSVTHAQAGDTEIGEIAALGGATFGIGAQPIGSGSAGVAFSRYGMVLCDVSFMPMGHHTIQPWPASSTVDRSYLLDFGLDFHVRIPVKERWAPYGIAGTGLLWNMIRQHTVDSQGMALVRHLDQFNGALHTGGGLRYYVHKRWGIRSEAKVIVSKQIYTELLVGVFYAADTDWP